MKRLALDHDDEQLATDDENEFILKTNKKMAVKQPKKSLTEQFMNRYYTKLPVVDEINNDPVVNVYDDSEIV
jgi:hypothetical protein